MLNYYEQTELELWIQDLYKSNGILSPSDISVKNLSKTLDIPISLAPGITEEIMRDELDEDFFVIYLDSNKPPEQQKESFLHELCHGLRHVGNQVKMPEGLRQLQEEQAKQFVPYAAIPYFMIKDLGIHKYDRVIIHQFAEEFGVTHKLAARRLEQIKNRIYMGQAREEFVNKLRSQYTISEPQPLSAETLRLLEQLQRQTAKKGV